MAEQESNTANSAHHGEIQSQNGSISPFEISKPAFPVNLAAVLPCYRESEEGIQQFKFLCVSKFALNESRDDSSISMIRTESVDRELLVEAFS